jgi:hypothetical protein
MATQFFYIFIFLTNLILQYQVHSSFENSVLYNISTINIFKCNFDFSYEKQTSIIQNVSVAALMVKETCGSMITLEKVKIVSSLQLHRNAIMVFRSALSHEGNARGYTICIRIGAKLLKCSERIFMDFDSKHDIKSFIFSSSIKTRSCKLCVIDARKETDIHSIMTIKALNEHTANLKELIVRTHFFEETSELNLKNLHYMNSAAHRRRKTRFELNITDAYLGYHISEYDLLEMDKSTYTMIPRTIAVNYRRQKQTSLGDFQTTIKDLSYVKKVPQVPKHPAMEDSIFLPDHFNPSVTTWLGEKIISWRISTTRVSISWMNSHWNASDRSKLIHGYSQSVLDSSNFDKSRQLEDCRLLALRNNYQLHVSCASHIGMFFSGKYYVSYFYMNHHHSNDTISISEVVTFNDSPDSQKNWMPFEYNGRVLYVKNIDELVIVEEARERPLQRIKYLSPNDLLFSSTKIVYKGMKMNMSWAQEFGRNFSGGTPGLMIKGVFLVLFVSTGQNLP